MSGEQSGATAAGRRPAGTRKSAKPARILYLSPPWPYRSIRSLHIARALQSLGTVDRVVIHSEDTKSVATRDEGAGFKIVDELDVLPCAPRSIRQKVAEPLNSRTPFPHGNAVSEEGERAVLRRSKDYDLIWFFKLRTANMFKTWAWPRSVLDIDDLPSGVYQSALASSLTLKERARNWLQVLSWHRREKLLGKRFTTLSVCSEADKSRLNAGANFHVIPNGFERPAALPVHNPATPIRIGFIGLFDYFANHEGVQWFVEKCWPLIKKELPDARLRLVGRGSDGPIAGLGPDIDGLGWVDDTAAEIATWSSMIIPLLTGGGTRVKIAESFSRKCPMVSTRLGAYGYEVEDGRQLRLADSPPDFARACIELVRDPDEAARMAERGWEDFLRKWTWDAIAPKVWAAAEECLRLGHAG